MLSGKYWPVRPRPLPGEILTSWLVRIAHAHGFSAQSFCDRAFGSHYQIWNRDIDRQAPNWLLKHISMKTGHPLWRVKRMSLAIYEGRLFPKALLSGKQQWLLPLHIYHRTRHGFGTQFCPICVQVAKEPYFQRIWRLALYTFCPYHGIMLHDRCPKCKQAVAYFRQGIGAESYTEANPLSICVNCGFDLAQTEVRPLYVWDEDVHRRWRYAQAKTEALQIGNDKWGYTIFPVLHQLCKVLTGRWRKNNLLAYAEFSSSSGTTPIDFGIRGFENRPIAERHHLLSLAFWLLGKWPKRLLAAWEAGVVTYSLLVKDGKNLPDWYHNSLIPLNKRNLA
jgi:TniQ.